MNQRIKKLLPFFLLYLVYLLGHFMDIMDIDAAQYASIAREMSDSGNFLQVKLRGEDYLDKPPLLFWVSVLSFKIFGYTNFAFRLIPVLISLLGIYAVYRLTKLYYAKKAAYIAALVWASCQACFLMNHDIRTDTMFAAMVTVSLWLIAAYIQTNRVKYFIFGFIAIACSMLAKGPLGLIIPVFAFSTDFILKRQWKNFLRWEWILGILITATVLLPMSLGLYWQYDVQGTKIVNNQEINSGLKFFYWTQSFGRITGENTWKNDAGPFFFVHSFIWSFLPWSFVFIPAFFISVYQIIKNKLKTNTEALSIGGFSLTFIALSLSQFKLPHYTFVVFPLAAVICGQFIYQLIYEKKYLSVYPYLKVIQYLTVVVLWALIAYLIFYVFPVQKVWIVLVLVVLLMVSFIFLFKKMQKQDLKVGYMSFIAILAANFTLNAHFYPELMQYQAQSKVAKRVYRDPKIDKERFYHYTQDFYFSLDFYTRSVTQFLDDKDALKGKKGTYWVYTDEKGLKELKMNYPLQILEKYQHYHVTALSLEFLNPETRANVTDEQYLVEIKL